MSVMLECDLSYRSEAHPQKFHAMHPGIEIRTDGTIISFCRCEVTGEKYAFREHPVYPDGTHVHKVGNDWSNRHPAARKHRVETRFPWEIASV